MSFWNDFRYPVMAQPGAKAWRIWFLLSVVFVAAGAGTYFTGQYKIGRLNVLKDHYDEPVDDFAAKFNKAKSGSMEQDLLDGCRQVQIGTWLQTTDALSFEPPVIGNRVVVKLDPEKAYIDLNGRELAVCIQDEIENRQYDIGSMTNTWAGVLVLLGGLLGGWALWLRYNLMGGSAARPKNIYAQTLEQANPAPTTYYPEE